MDLAENTDSGLVTPVSGGRICGSFLGFQTMFFDVYFAPKLYPLVCLLKSSGSIADVTSPWDVSTGAEADAGFVGWVGWGNFHFQWHRCDLV